MDEQRRHQVMEVAARLKERYGYTADAPMVFNDAVGVVAGPESKPLTGLIETILSQQSTIATTQRMSEALRRAFPTWHDALAAGAVGIQQVLQEARGNLTRVKAEYIYGVLQRLVAERDGLSLQFLRAWPDAAVREYLAAFAGVGPKTIACVLLFNLQRPAMPVDTHVQRIAQRLGWVSPSLVPQAVGAWLEEHLPAHWEAHYELHLNAIEHGRFTCQARRPQCSDCVLRDLCPSALPHETGVA